MRGLDSSFVGMTSRKCPATTCHLRETMTNAAWFCPQTMFQLVERYPLTIDRLCWLETDYPSLTRRRFLGPFLNSLVPHFVRRRQALRNDFGVVLKKK